LSNSTSAAMRGGGTNAAFPSSKDPTWASTADSGFARNFLRKRYSFASSACVLRGLRLRGVCVGSGMGSTQRRTNRYRVHSLSSCTTSYVSGILYNTPHLFSQTCVQLWTPSCAVCIPAYAPHSVFWRSRYSLKKLLIL